MDEDEALEEESKDPLDRTTPENYPKTSLADLTGVVGMDMGELSRKVSKSIESGIPLLAT